MGARLIGLILAGVAAHAQTFAVASIKANHSGERIMSYQPGRGGKFTATNSSLGLIVQYAYDVLDFQISGAPDWVKSDRYDIAAKADGNPPVREIPALVQRLLEDRFQLKYHWETKEAATYDLVVSKAGKLKESLEGECPPQDPCGALRNSPGHTYGRKLTAAQLADGIAFFVQRAVVDRTGLAGRYDIELQWTPDALDPAGFPIFTALQEQLGLKLVPGRSPVKTLVIDRVERPSEN